MEGNDFKKGKSRLVTTRTFSPGMLPPQAVDLEEAILGQLILEFNICFEKVQFMLSPEVFYKEPNQVIYAAIQSLYSKDAPVDLLSVTQELRLMGKLDAVGGAFYVTTLTSRVASSANIQYHVQVVYSKYILRKLIQESEWITKQAYGDNTDPIELLEVALENFNTISDTISNMKDEDQENPIAKTKEKVNDVVINNKLLFYETGLTKFDSIIGITPNEILLIAGPAGSGKTRKLIFLMNRLLRKYDNISVLWYTFEDPSDKVIRCFAGINMMMKEELIRGKKKKMTTDELREFNNYIDNEFSQYDIVFVEEQKYIKQIHQKFVTFCKKRPDRFCICIIDNIMLLEDNTTDKDDIIARELVKMRKHTGGLILPLHHFNDEQMGKDMLKHAYRPRIVHLKGRESYRRACSQVVLMNKPGIYPDLIAEYKGQESILKNMLITEVAKNRDGTANDDDCTIIREWCNLDFIQFEEIE